MDEAAGVPDELIAAVRPALATTNGRIVALSTPHGKRGWFYLEWTSGIGWERTEIKAADCPRISKEFLADEQRTLGPHVFEQEYNCTFYDPDTAVFSSDMIERALTDAIKPLWGDCRVTLTASSPYPERPTLRNSKWILSVDLGRSIDPTAISVLEVITRRQAARTYWELSEEAREAPGVIVPPLEWYDTRDGGTGGIKWGNAMARVDVRHLERLPLKMPYPQQIAYIAEILKRPPLAYPRAELILDQTAVGRPIVDMFRQKG